MPSPTRLLAGLGLLAASCLALAFPPAPRHTVFGMVRDAMGEPLLTTNAVVILETSAGVKIRASVSAQPHAGINYSIAIPMDAGLTSDSYKPTALRPTTPFRLKVIIGATTYYPMEIKADYINLGKPAQRTRLDLTLGEDSDGDGLPDAWERALIAMRGGNLTLADIGPNSDTDGDGVSNAQEYAAGTYAFDPQDGFRLDIAGTHDGHPVLEFLAIRGRTYTLMQSSDLKTWTPISFRLQEDGPAGAERSKYQASDVKLVRVEPAAIDTQPGVFFFKAMVE